MAQFLMVHCNRLVNGVQYLGVSSIASYLKKSGHGFALFDSAEYLWNGSGKSHMKSLARSVDLQHKAVSDKRIIPGKKKAALVADLVSYIKKNRPNVIGFSSFTDDWPFAFFLIKTVYEQFPEIPIIVGGVHATINPNQVIKHHQVTAVCIGEGEIPIVKFLDSIDSGKIDKTIHSFWFKNGNRYIVNPLSPAFEFDQDTPFVNWDYFNDFHFYYPFNGKLYRRGSVSLGRGCPFYCNYCINSFYKSKLYDFGYRVRRKKVEFAIEELVYLKKRHRLEFLRFWDETFLSMPLDTFKLFAKYYAKKVDLPFTIETTAQSIDREKLELLSQMGCLSISIGVETSNELLRKNILNKNITNEQFSKIFKLISEFKMQKVANFMFFLPHQTVEDMYNDIKYCHEWGIESPAPRIFYPYLGTNLREYCLKNNLINLSLLNRKENENSVSSLSELGQSWHTFENTVLDFDKESQAAGKLLLENFILLQEMPLWSHKWVLKHVKENTPESKRVVAQLKSLIYNKKYGS